MENTLVLIYFSTLLPLLCLHTIPWYSMNYKTRFLNLRQNRRNVSQCQGNTFIIDTLAQFNYYRVTHFVLTISKIEITRMVLFFYYWISQIQHITIARGVNTHTGKKIKIIITRMVFSMSQSVCVTQAI